MFPVYEDPVIAIAGIYFIYSYLFFFFIYSMILFLLFDFMLSILNLLFSLPAPVNKLKRKKKLNPLLQ